MAERTRLAFLDVLRGVALIVMVVNHTSRWWIDRQMGWSRYWLVYATVTVAAPIFLFLVGFVLPVSLHRNAAEMTAPSRLWSYTRRGLQIILAGLLLNVVVFSEKLPFSDGVRETIELLISGGVLQTIGLSIIVMTLLAPLLRYRGGGYALLGVALGAYLLFLVAHPHLQGWLLQHRLVGLVLFFDYAPWPWMCIVLVGLVLGWWWREVAARGPDAGFFVRLAAVGAVLMVAALLAEWWWPSRPHIGFTRDLGLNNHWIPGPITGVWILGTVFVLLSLFYWLCEVRGWRPGWLVMLGQTALMLYFVHQIIAYSLANKWLHVNFKSWAMFWTSNLALIVICIGLGYAWKAIKSRALRRVAVPG
jgi:Heparan-alpha-glucosaminide N-acetyltransferase, catalytic